MIIADIITKLRETTTYKYKFHITETIEDCIVYDYYDTQNDAIKKQATLQLHIIVTGSSENDIIRLESMKDNINQAILTVADNQFNNSILSIEQNGGGSLVDANTDTTHRILYYNILYK